MPWNIILAVKEAKKVKKFQHFVFYHILVDLSFSPFFLFVGFSSNYHECCFLWFRDLLIDNASVDNSEGSRDKRGEGISDSVALKSDNFLEWTGRLVQMPDKIPFFYLFLHFKIISNDTIATKKIKLIITITAQKQQKIIKILF